MTYKNVDLCNNTQLILDKFLAIREEKTGIPSPSKSNILEKDTPETHLSLKLQNLINIKQKNG